MWSLEKGGDEAQEDNRLTPLTLPTMALTDRGSVWITIDRLTYPKCSVEDGPMFT